LKRARFADVAAAVDAVRPLWRGDGATTAMTTAAPPLLELRGVGFAYAVGREVLCGVDLRLCEGEITALVGPNGCGKTTLSKQMNGLLRPTRGEVWRRGRNQRDQSLAEIAHDVAYVFQDPDQQIFAATVEEEVRFALDNRELAADEKEARVAAALRRVDMAGHRRADPFLLPKGLRQRLAVASMLVVEPALLILDEPTTGLDDREQRALMEIVEGLAARGMAVLMITHAPWVVAEHARRCVAMHGGAIVYDGPTHGFLADLELARRCDFTPPDAARVAAALGGSAGSVEELLAQLDREGGR
jgi:energy-coupling factor transport system ATP-binding protein